jgi:hypothetical protein
VEADWEVEIGPEAPVIDALWPGYVDLWQTPASARQLPEVTLLHDLDEALVRLNGAHSPVWTAKCDVWPLAADEFDVDEMNAVIESAICGWGCYIDLLPRSDQQWALPAMAISWCKRICNLLHDVPLSCSRADMIVRQAVIAPLAAGTGITIYLTACGSTSEEANCTLQAALGRFVDALCGPSTIE